MFKKIVYSSTLLLLVGGCNKSEDFFKLSEKSENPIQSKDLVVQAKENVNLKLLTPKSDPSKFKITDRSSPIGADINLPKNVIQWQTDIQDIGKSVPITLNMTDGKNTSKNEFKIEIVPPKIVKKECSVEPVPVIGSIAPELKWHWKGFADYKLTFSSPVAGDLDGDGVVEIISMISTRSYSNTNGPIVVLNAKTGDLLWKSTDNGISAEVSNTPAIIDLDNDGKAEIVSVAIGTGGSKKINIINYNQKQIVSAYEDSFICGPYCIPAVGDIDGDGSPEIVAGNVVLNSSGVRKFFLTPQPTGLNVGPVTVTLADLDTESPGLEIIIKGSQVYSSTGNFLWSGSCTKFSAVGDLNQDKKPELICTSNGNLWVYSGNGVLLWTKPLEGGGNGGAPNIGSFLNNNEHQIGIAGGSKYSVYDKDGNKVWSANTQDQSSSSTGSTVFDFNGDGKVEVVYNDETHIRIFDGSNGTVIWSSPNISGTLWEYPVIVDVDNDNSADIVVPAPGWHTDDIPTLDQGGIKVFGDPLKRWVRTRKVWNQYSYFPEIITDQLKSVVNPGIPKEGFRVNYQGSLQSEGKILLPDLAIHSPLFPDENSNGGRFSFYITNLGEANSDVDKKIVIMNTSSDEIIGEKILNDLIEPGMGLLISVDIDKSKFKNANDLKVLLNIDPLTEQAYSNECDYENNVDKFRLVKHNRAEKD